MQTDDLKAIQDQLTNDKVFEKFYLKTGIKVSTLFLNQITDFVKSFYLKSTKFFRLQLKRATAVFKSNCPRSPNVLPKVNCS